MNDLDMDARLQALAATTRGVAAPPRVWRLMDDLDARPVRRSRLALVRPSRRTTRTLSAFAGLAATVVLAVGLLVAVLPVRQQPAAPTFSAPPIASWRLLHTFDLTAAQPMFAAPQYRDRLLSGFLPHDVPVGNGTTTGAYVVSARDLADWKLGEIPEPVAALGLLSQATVSDYSAVAERGGRMVAVGYVTGTPPEVAANDGVTPSPTIGLTWTSDDGLRWTESGGARIQGAYLDAVVATDDGFLAGGGLADDGSGSAATVLWRSADGTSWQPVAVPGVTAGYRTTTIARGGGGYLAVATVAGLNGDRTTLALQGSVLLYSTDAQHWTVAERTSGEVIVAARYVDGRWEIGAVRALTDGRRDVRVGTSTDGQHWQWSSRPSDAFATAVAAGSAIVPFRGGYLRFDSPENAAGTSSGFGYLDPASTPRPGMTRQVVPIPSSEQVIWYDTPTATPDPILVHRFVGGQIAGPPSVGPRGYFAGAVEVPQGVVVLALDGSIGSRVEVWLGTP